jgi:UDP-glucose 4-epimerase
MAVRNKIIVTGGAGYIGSHTIVALLERTGHEVLSIDNFSNASPATFDRIERITGVRVPNAAIDLCDREAVMQTMGDGSDVLGIIHFAAFKSVPESVRFPHRYHHNNINSLLNMLHAAEACGIPNFIFSSSCSVYGNIASLPVREDTPLGHAESPYAYTKQVGERIVDDITRAAEGLRAISLRYFNPVGAHASGTLGEDPLNPPTSLVPVITRTAIGRNPVVTVHGTDYGTRDGSCIRDYVHVSDIANAHVLALRHAAEGRMAGVHELFNLGTGTGVSVLEAIHAFQEVSGSTLNFVLGPRRAGDVEAIYSDTTRSRTVLGWEAEHDLHNMLRTAWLWEQHLASL